MTKVLSRFAHRHGLTKLFERATALRVQLIGTIHTSLLRNRNFFTIRVSDRNLQAFTLRFHGAKGLARHNGVIIDRSNHQRRLGVIRSLNIRGAVHHGGDISTAHMGTNGRNGTRRHSRYSKSRSLPHVRPRARRIFSRYRSSLRPHDIRTTPAVTLAAFVLLGCQAVRRSRARSTHCDCGQKEHTVPGAVNTSPAAATRHGVTGVTGLLLGLPGVTGTPGGEGRS